MSRIAYIDPVGGLAGDMLCGALIDLGADVDQIASSLASLGLDDGAIEVRSVRRGPFAARHFIVHAHEHHPHRTWGEVRALILGAALPPRARQRALDIFERLARAEGAVHGIAAERVTFHEVGAIDSIVDILGVCLALEQLDVSALVCAPLPLGSGTAHTAHGPIPLPAPATVGLLLGWPVIPGHPGGERVTPTGAAIVAALATPGRLPPMVLLGAGYGAGTRDPDNHANVVRVILGTPMAEQSAPVVVQLDTQLDDLSGEHVPDALSALFDAGALDAWTTPILMKKGRPGHQLSALCTPELCSAVESAMLRHSSAFGVRSALATRRLLARHHETVSTPWGPVRVKVGVLDGETVHAAPEHDDVARIARVAGVPTPRVHSLALAAWHGRPPGDPE